ncbi:hypothetical protein RCL1_005369 [Eukaryota sp. TZLM3-RCL]
MSSVGASTHSGSSSLRTTWKNDAFNFISRVYSSTSKANVLIKLLLAFELLQLVALTINSDFAYIHKALDPRSFLQFIRFSGYDSDSYSLLSHSFLTVFLVVSASLALLLLLTGSYYTRDGRSVTVLLVFTKIFIEIISAIFFLPLTITAFTWTHCSDNSTFFAVSLNQCWSAEYLFYRSIILFSWIILFGLVLLKESIFIDISFKSKRIFASLDRRFNLYLLTTKIIFAFL